MPIGKFITIEGGEGAAKSTQARLIAERLKDMGREVVVTREPGGTPFAEQLREILLGGTGGERSPAAEALGFYAARLDHLELLIRPGLARGAWVVCDRFSDSTRVYQGVAGMVPVALIDAFEKVVVAATRPDLTVMLDLDPELGLRRAELRRGERGEAGADRYEGRNLAYHQQLRDGFLAIAAGEPDRCVVVDGNGDIEAIGNAIWGHIQSRLMEEG